MNKINFLPIKFYLALLMICPSGWTFAAEIASPIPGMTFAKGENSKKRSGTREKRIVREEQYKSKTDKDTTAIDFDSVDIGGERKTPLGSLVGRSKAENDYDFIKIRKSWHPEMIQSATSLESAGSN